MTVDPAGNVLPGGPDAARSARLAFCDTEQCCVM